MSLYRDITDDAPVSFQTQSAGEQISAYGGNVYLSMRDEGAHFIAQYNAKGQMLGQWMLPADMAIYQIEAAKDSIYILALATATQEAIFSAAVTPSPDDGHSHVQEHIDGACIYKLDKATGKLALLKVPSWENKNISTFCVYEDTLCALGDLVSMVDLAKGVCLGSQQLYGFFGYIQKGIEADECVLMVDSGGTSLSVMDIRTGKLRSYFNTNAWYGGLRRNSDTLVMVDVAMNELVTLPLLPLPQEEKSLTLVNSNGLQTEPRMMTAIAMFHERYPNTEILFQDVTDARMLAASLLAGDPNYDILFVQEDGYLCSRVMQKAGALADLKQFPEIMAQLEQWINITPLISQGGQVYGIPHWMLPYGWRVNTELFEKIGFDIPPENWTWEDFFALGDQLMAYNAQTGSHYRLLNDLASVPYILKQYNANEIDIMNSSASYDSETFRMLMARWKACADARILYYGDTNRYSIAETLFTVERIQHGTLEDTRYILPPVYDADTCYPALTQMVVLNANAADIEAAAYFIACYASPEALISSEVYSSNRYLKDWSLYPPAYYEYLSFRTAISEENERYWEAMLENGIQDFIFADIEVTLIMELYPMYMQGAMTLEEFASTLQRMADMALGE